MSISGLGEDLPRDESNLVIRAARALQEATGYDSGARIHVTKRIPVAGGMAGGSADAAATLVALNELWGLDLSAAALHEIGAGLGSDVPFALHGGLALGRGRGELLEPIRPGMFLSFVFVTDSDGLSTPAAFRAYDAAHPEPHEPASADDLVAALQGSDVSALRGLLVNDLEPIALSLRPELREKMDRAARFGVGNLISGSGPTIAILLEDPSEADAVAGALRTDGLTTLRADGPAAGAHLRN